MCAVGLKRIFSMSNIYKGKLLPRGWFVYTTDEGKPYFHNRLTASTQWEVPSDTSHTLGDSMSTLNEVDTLMNHGGTEGEIAFLEQTAIESTTYRDQMLHLSDDPSMQTGETDMTYLDRVVLIVFDIP